MRPVDYLYNSLVMLINFLPALISIAFVIYFERKTLGGTQRRLGPNTVGINGILQSFADGFKLVLKENLIPNKSNKVIFVISSVLMFSLSILN